MSHSFILISSTDENDQYVATTSNQELQHLKENYEVILLNDLLNKQGIYDPEMIAVYDLIVALKATSFAACSLNTFWPGGYRFSNDISTQLGCTRKAYDICKKCASVSKLGKIATALRRQRVDNSSTYDCWPVDGLPSSPKNNS